MSRHLGAQSLDCSCFARSARTMKQYNWQAVTKRMMFMVEFNHAIQLSGIGLN